MRDAGPGAALGPAITAAWRACRDDHSGALASYIPQLAQAEPERFGLCLCTREGELHGAGDVEVEFTIQSIAKPLMFAAALTRHGRERVLERVGVEPTGRRFDSILRLAATTGGRYRPFNPMVNSGAIAVTDMLASGDGARDVRELLDWTARFVGREVHVDLPVLVSERDAAHQNRAAAYLLRHCGALHGDVEQVLDLYFHHCSVLVSCRDLAVLGATLAAGGRNPCTGEQVVTPQVASDTVAVMSTCGMYDAAGRFLFDVGLPAKSGVSGGLVAVAPGRLGFAAFSPRLDEQGNTVRGTAAARALSRGLDLHVFAEPRRATFDLETLRRTLEAVRRELIADDAAPLALCAVRADGGETTGTGPLDQPLPIQAAANAFAYALAVERHGLQAVGERAGVEPSGNPYHAIRLDPRGRPFNPLGNAGAITICAMVPGADGNERLRAQLDDLAALADEPRLVVDAAVLQHERATGDRNRAIASLLRGRGVIADEAAALELYFQQCALRVTPQLLARMAAVLAADGVRPRDGARLLRRDTVRATLSLMYTCGLHDESGRFAFEVGLPAKSGISGGLVAVVPGQLGLAAWSPGVNDHGTSLLGRKALVEVSRRLGLSVFLAPPDTGPA